MNLKSKKKKEKREKRKKERLIGDWLIDCRVCLICCSIFKSSINFCYSEFLNAEVIN